MQEEALCEPYEKVARDNFDRWMARSKERYKDDSHAFAYALMPQFLAYSTAGFDRRRKDRVGYRDKKSSRRIRRYRGQEIDALEEERKGPSEEDDMW